MRCALSWCTGLEMEVVRWFLSGLGCVTDQTISKKARQPLSLIIWPSPPNSMLRIAPCSDRWCCSLQEVRRGHRAVSRQGLQKRSPTASVFLFLQTQMAKQLAMLVWWVFCFLFFFFLSLQNSNEYILYQWVEDVTYLARGCVSHAVV